MEKINSSKEKEQPNKLINENNLSYYINESKKLIKKKSMKDVKLAFLSNFTINGLAETMKVLCFEQRIYAETYAVPYNQYAQEILNKSSKLYDFNSDIIFILLDSEQLLDSMYKMDEKQREKYTKEKFDELRGLINILKENTNAKIVFNTLLVPLYSSRGIIENKQKFGLKKSIHRFNEMFESLSIDDSQLFIFDFNSFCSKMGYENLVDRKMYYLGDMRISPMALVNIGIEYMAYIFPLTSSTKKCVILDLDNTLWGGILGEEGTENIKLGPEKDGKPFLDFQKRLLELFERGIILAINSKNNYNDVIEVMKKHKYMLLKENNFACIKINWKDKVTNTREIAKELNIGLDSLVFLDDDKTNRELIKKFIPEVMVVDLPEDPSLYPKVIEDLKVFNTFTITGEDLNRGKMYVSQKKRGELKLKVKDLESFLKQLGIKVNISSAKKSNISRIAQLTQKTNQFNLTTRRYQDADIKKFSESKEYIVKCIDVEDKFGDYGITGIAIVKKNKEDWLVDSFLLSCRILGKEIEKVFLGFIIEEAKKEGIKKLIGEFISTKKNSLAKDFYKSNKFELGKKTNEKEIWNFDLKNKYDYPKFFIITKDI
ncbi:MAG: HAD family hydrolase [Nanoarchaeota archaeon]|nr:HAD family hydrolase [Nanoarchaeota archaeon]